MTYCVNQRALTSNLKVTVADRSDVALARQEVYQSNNAMMSLTVLYFLEMKASELVPRMMEVRK